MSAERRWMLFVDGENFTIQAQKLAATKGLMLPPSKRYERDVYFWPQAAPATAAIVSFGMSVMPLKRHPVRAHYYATTVGSEEVVDRVKGALREMGFSPHVFRKEKANQKTKGVDIAFATDVLSNAYRDNYDAAVLVAGDGDYVPLVEEIKHAGKLALLWFFDDASLSPRLRLSCDAFEDHTRYFDQVWREAPQMGAGDA